MILPRASARLGVFGGGWAAAALLGVALALAGPPPALADDDPYTATVKVDATADTVQKAREEARLDGQRRALAAIAERFANGAPVKLPKLDDNALGNLVQSFEVANERMSAVRYIADVTFHFRPAETQRVLRAAGLALGGSGAEPAGKTLVIVPLYQAGRRAVLWDDPNPWRDAWAGRGAAPAGPYKLIVPLGDVADIGTIDAAKARAGDAEALAAIARQNGAEDAVVALATLRGPAAKPAGLDVAVKRYHLGQPADAHAANFDAKPDEDEAALLHRAAEAVAASIAGGWKNEPPVEQMGSLTAVLQIAGLDDWVRLRDRLGGVGAIRKVDLLALTRAEATIEIQYVGTIDQLKSALAGIGLDLVRGEPNWRLARAPGSAAR